MEQEQALAGHVHENVAEIPKVDLPEKMMHETIVEVPQDARESFSYDVGQVVHGPKVFTQRRVLR